MVLRTSLALLLVVASQTSAQQLMAPHKLAAVRASLPDLTDEDAHALLHSDRVMWYTNAEIPAAFQHSFGGSTGFHSAFHNFSGDPSDSGIPDGLRSGGHANGEFPWLAKPGGAHNSPSVLSYKGLLLPEGKPVVWFYRHLPGRVGNGIVVSGGGGASFSGGRQRVFGWMFPKGAVLIEVLTMREPLDKTDVVFEVRFRTREIDEWAVDLYRPFVRAEDLATAIEKLDGESRYHAPALASLRSTDTLPTARLVDSMHTRKHGFDNTSEIYEIPRLATADVLTLLDRPFSSALGETFKGDAAAPSNNKGDFSIVPPNYAGTFVGSDRITCAQCHESTNVHATVFQQPRGWYGRIRGSDGIFSWHPIAPSSISSDGATYPVRFRRAFVDAGMLDAFNRAKHPIEEYRLIKGLN